MLFKKMLPIGAAAVLAGCASLPADRGMSDVRGLVKDHSGLAIGQSEDEGRAQVASLMARPINSDAAVSIALVRSPVLKREYARLGFALSDVLEAGRLSNPTLSMSVLNSNAFGDRSQIGFGLVQNFTDLLFLSAKGRIARADLARIKQEAGSRIFDFAVEVRQAYIRVVSAKQIAQMREVIAHSAETSGELAKRMHDAGNLSELQWKREQAAGTKARLEAEAAQAEAVTSKLQLNALMGLRISESGWKLEESLPLPVQDESSLDQLQAIALERRLDLSAKRDEVAQVDAIRGLAQKLRWLGVVEVGIEGERETDGTRLLGPSFSLQLPIFNQGQASIARVDATASLVESELVALEAETGIAVAQAYQNMLAARSRAERHLQQLIPQREAVVARTQELQNFMIVGQFELLAAKEEEYDAYQSYLEALRDYWVARTELTKAIGGQLPSDARISSKAAEAITLPATTPAMNMSGHSGHSMPGMSMDSGDMSGAAMEHGAMNHGDSNAKSDSPEQGSEKERHGHHSMDPPAEAVEQPVIQETPHAPHN